MYLLTVTVPGRGDPTEVVAAQVDEHHVLGPLLGVALELLGEELRPRARPRRAAASRRWDGWSAGRPRTWRSSSGEAPDDLERRRAHEEQVRARVDPTQRAVQPDAVELRRRSRRPAAGRTTGGGRARPGSPRRPRSRPWRPRPRGCTASRPRLVSIGPASERRGRRAVAPAARPASSAALGRAVRSRASKMACLGDPVAALEVGRLGVERGDRRQRVGQVVEDEDEVGLDEGGRRDADRVALGQRHARLEDADRRRRRARRPRRR